MLAKRSYNTVSLTWTSIMTNIFIRQFPILNVVTQQQETHSPGQSPDQCQYQKERKRREFQRKLASCNSPKMTGAQIWGRACFRKVLYSHNEPPHSKGGPLKLGKSTEHLVPSVSQACKQEKSNYERRSEETGGRKLDRTRVEKLLMVSTHSICEIFEYVFGCTFNNGIDLICECESDVPFH